MNKLSFKLVEEIFLQKYPTGAIWRTNENSKNQYTLNVAYKQDGKVYTYNVKNNADAVNKLKLDIKLMYTRDYNEYCRQLAELKENINKGFYTSGFFEEDMQEETQYTKEEINKMKYEIECIEHKIKDIILI